MIKYKSANQLSIEEFQTPFELKLDKENRWVKLASIIPWDELAGIYYQSMSTGMGAPSIDARIVIGSMVIKHKLKLDDREVVETIRENIYLQYFLGFSAYTAEPLFDRSQSINSSDTSITRSTQLDYAIPASTIASLSSGEFVGFVADNPGQRIPQKMFHCALQNDHEAIARETAAYKELPRIRQVTAEDVQENYQKIKAEVLELVRDELARPEARKSKKPEEAVALQALDPSESDPEERLSI